jgi:hypothetical protein
MKNDWKQVFPFEVTAIDILLEPDATMLEHCKAGNERLLSAYPQIAIKDCSFNLICLSAS